MFVKSRTLALALATAGVMGFGAPMASACTTSGGPGDNGGLLSNNLNNDQVLPFQICNNNIPTDLLGGQASSDLGRCDLSNGQGNRPWLGDPGSQMADPPAYGNGDWPGDNGGWSGNNHRPKVVVVVPIQICGIQVNVIKQQKQQRPDEPWGSNDGSGRNTITQKNNCKQFNF
jgi:hypothetical protein